MGILKSCLSTSGGSVVVAEFALYDEAEAIAVTPTNPGFDDLMGEPFLEDNDSDQVGERVRPEDLTRILGKLSFTRNEEQRQNATGNSPRSFAMLRVSRGELERKGLLVDGVYGVRPNDRILRVRDRVGRILHEFEHGNRDGLYVVEVRPGETGSNVVDIHFVKRRPSAD